MAEPEPLPVIAERLAKILVRVSTKLAEQRGDGYGSGGLAVAGGGVSDRTATIAMRNVSGIHDQTEADYRYMRRAFAEIGAMARRHGVT